MALLNLFLRKLEGQQCADNPRKSHHVIRSVQLYKGAGSFHIHRKTMKELGALAVLGIRERPNLA